MNITIKINTDNAAFEDDPGAEVARILGKVTGDFLLNPDIATVQHRTPLLDVNGNTIGYIEVKE